MASATRAPTVLLIAIAWLAGSWHVAPEAAPPPAPEPAARVAEPQASGALADPVAAVRDHLGTRTTGLEPRERLQAARAIVHEARARDLDPWLVVAVIRVESSFHNFAASPVGALGLMQILPSTGRALAQELGIPWRGAQTLFDPVVNVRIGVAYLERLRDRFGHLPTALAAYNWGPSRIGRRIREGAPVPGDYARRVLSAYAERAAPPMSRSS